MIFDKRFYSQAWVRIWNQISKYEKILSRRPIEIFEEKEKEIKKEYEEIEIKDIKEIKIKNKDKKNDQLKKINKLELAVTVIEEIPYNGAQIPGVHDTINGALIKNPDLCQPLGAPSVCIKLLTDSLLSALIFNQKEIKENFSQKMIGWEVRKKQNKIK